MKTFRSSLCRRSEKGAKALKERLKSSSQDTGEQKGRSDPPEIPARNEPQEAPFNLQPPAPSPGDQYTNLVAIKTVEAK